MYSSVYTYSHIRVIETGMISGPHSKNFFLAIFFNSSFLLAKTHNVVHQWMIICINIESTYVCCTLQHTATHCNTLQHIATLYNTLQHTTTHYDLYNHMHQYRIYVCVLHTNCKTLQHTATQCNTLQHTTHIIICINIESTYIFLYVYIQIGTGTIKILHQMF